MERQVLLAAILSGLVIIVWYALFVPPPTRPPTSQQESPMVTSPPATSEQTPHESEPAASTPATTAEVPAAVVGTDIQDVIVEGRGLRVVVSPRGASSAHWSSTTTRQRPERRWSCSGRARGCRCRWEPSARGTTRYMRSNE